MARVAKIGMLFIGLCAGVSFAQIQIGPPIKLPISACPSTCIPAEPDECCDAGPLACTRTDFGPYLVSLGEPLKISDRVECEHCLSNCPCCPVFSNDTDCVRCWEVPSKECGPYDIDLSFTESVTINLSSRLRVSLTQLQIASMQSMLSSLMGAVDGREFEFTAECGFSMLPPCNDGFWAEPYIQYRSGRALQIDHVWKASGFWVSDCDPETCPTEGYGWGIECASDSSTISGNRFDRQSCGTIVGSIPCGD